MTLKRITIFGAGNIGSALATLLARTGRFELTVCDVSEDALEPLRAHSPAVRLLRLPRGEEHQALAPGCDLVIGAVPDQALPMVASAALKACCHYLDFVSTPDPLKPILADLARTRTVLPASGVSPGFVGALAASLLQGFSPVGDLIIRVGAIPRYPTNRLGYGQIWNVDGLIEEYTRPSAAIRDSQRVNVSPLEDYERLTVDGMALEAFTTSGGMCDLDVFAPFAPRNVTVKTIRYPGHLDYMRFLLDDLGLRHRRDMLRSLLMNGLPVIEDDVLHVLLTARGTRGRQPSERTLRYSFAPNPDVGPFNALTSLATGYATSLICALADGLLPAAGMVTPQMLDAGTLLASPFIAPLLEA
ncbi:saccharopine dehydrogenase C-terminal domain-containing protein [Pannonibacter carbonis]|uniref:saccharopine dehydrogenase C-terminal domain-containing protein n=1 Tax=Pannonibacter carbonis TaxID=2067569 RepID=UPI000D0F6FB5|nr:saccharopine dehydrogenase C-terminal domain-containing protein [Pannonibacter carbonis]